MVKNDLPVGENGPGFNEKLRIIAHRGASALAPENTLAAFQRAVDDKADGIEFDVRLARDGEAVVFHDSTLDRTARREGKVSDFTSAELRKIDVGTWFNDSNRKMADRSYSKQNVSTLAEVLDFLKEFEGIIYIELKCKDAEVEQLSSAVAKAITNSPLLPRIIVKSFKLAVLPQIKALVPGVRTAALFAPKIMAILRKEKYLVKIAEEFGADEISLHYSLATRKLMKKAGSRGLPVAIWTADSPRWLGRAIKLGLKAIITNDPARLIAKRNELLAST
ncbi:MAG: glycerophosphodiester phosphodiesterase [Blastocatellia bacterium]